MTVASTMEPIYQPKFEQPKFEQPKLEGE